MADSQALPNESERGPAGPTTFHRHIAGRWEVVHGAVVRENPVTIFVNQQELVTLMCTPVRVNHLVFGFLKNEGLISCLDDVDLMRVCDEEATVDVRLRDKTPASWQRRTLTSGCGGGYTVLEQIGALAPVQSSLSVAPPRVLVLMKQLQEVATLFRQFGGVHTAALSDGESLLAVAEDVARHNTIDKICGQCLLEAIPTEDRLLLTTGRLSSEIVLKAAKMRIPLLISRNSPTARAVSFGVSLGITLVGYARGSGFTVYSMPERIQGGGGDIGPAAFHDQEAL